MTMLRSSRLLLRSWRHEDLAPFATLNADPLVMAHFPAPLDRMASDQLAERLAEALATRGFGFWAVELPGKADFIGFVGLSVPRFEAAFTPCVELGWRLAYEHWGQGYATEAASLALDHAFDRLSLNEVVAFTVSANRSSRAVMERLGMSRDPADDFDHPSLPDTHPLRRHVLYRINPDHWSSGRRHPPG